MNGVGDKNHGVRKYFYFIKEKVSSDWKDLACQLGVGQADISNIAGRNPDDKSCCRDLLEEWLKRKGERATIEVLMGALSKANLQSIVDELKIELTEQSRQLAGANQAQTESMKAPEGLKALETTNDSVKLGWTKVNSNQPNGYRLEQSTAFEENWASAQGDRKLLPATITEFTVVDLTPYKEYHFCVRSAMDRMGKLVLSERSVPLYVVAKQPYQPYRPRNIKLTDRTHASLSLTWKEPSPANDVNPACYEYVVEMCTHGNDKGLKRWTEYCRTTQCQCPINDQDNGIYGFRVSANNTENDVTSLPEEMGDPVIPIHIQTKSEWLIKVLKTFWPFPATTQPRSQESGSIIFNISCHDLEGLRELWMNYKLGKVKKFFENFFARLARLASVEADTELEIRIDKEDFYSCRRHLLLTRPTSKGFRVVRLGEGDSRGTRLGLSEDYPVYCKPISHKTTCSQLDFLDPAIPVDQLGLDRTISAEKLLALTHLSRQVRYSSIPGLDLAVVKKDQSHKQGNEEISQLRAAVRASREKSQRLEVQLNAAKAQLETERQETKALKKGVAKMTEEKEKAQKIILEHKIEIQQLQETNKNWEEGMQRAREQTEALMLNLTREAARQKEEKEQAQKSLQEHKIEIQQLQEDNKSMAATIEELMDAKHTTKGEIGGQDHGEKGDPEKETYQVKKEESEKRSQSGPNERQVMSVRLNKAVQNDQTDLDIDPPSTSQPKKTVPVVLDEESFKARKQVKADPDGAGPSGLGEMDQEPQTSHSAADIWEIHSKHGFKVEELTPRKGRKTIKGSSIPLILPNDMKYNASTGRVEKVHDVRRESLHVVPEALEVLEGIEEPVSVLAITGPCRTGKSYILSRLLGTADAFELGHSMDPQTFGIWMGTKVLRGKDFTIVLLDTEGIDAVGASAGQDASILVMTILLSSCLIYNSQNVPYQKDLKKMQCFTQLAKRITVKQGEKTQTSAFREFFPDFLWLLRDVSLKMVDEVGQEMDPTDYLFNKVLRHDDEDSFDESTSEKVVRAIRTFFPSVECARLERPSSDTEVMYNIAQNTDSLNPGFNKGVDNLTERLLLQSRAKRGYDKVSTVGGLALSIMAKQYVEAVNDPYCIPALDNTWQNTVEVMRVRAFEEAVMEYNNQMRSQIAAATNNGQVPLEESVENGIHGSHSTSQSTLMDLHKKLFDETTNMLLEKVGHFGINSEDQSTEDKKLVERMQNRLVFTVQREELSVNCEAEDGTTRKQKCFVVIGGELLHYIQQNKQLSENFCQDLCERLLYPISKQVESPSPDLDFDKLKGELTDARQQYKEQARGPEKWAVQQEMTKTIGKLEAEIEKIERYQSKILQARQREQEAELRAKEKDREMQQLKQTQEEKLRDMERLKMMEIEKIKLELEQQHEVEILKMKMADMQAQAEREKERDEAMSDSLPLLKRMEQEQELRKKRKSVELWELVDKMKQENASLKRDLNEQKPQNEQMSKQVDDMQQTQQETQPKMERQHGEQIETDQLKEEPPKRREGQEPADMSRDLEENKSSQTPSSTIRKTKKKGDGCTIS